MIPKYDITNPIFVDLETTCNGLKNSPEAHWDANRILLCGWAELPVYGEPVVNVNIGVEPLIDRILELYAIDHTMVTIVAHNAKFDLKHLYRAAPLLDWKRMVRCYCTMYAEYRLSGMTNQFMSLEAACKLRGIEFKKGLDLGALLKAGVKMEDIPHSDLIPYLKGDVVALMQLFCHQIKENGAEHIRHSHIMALADIELEGMVLDTTLAKDRMGELAADRIKAEGKLDALLCKYMDWKEYTDRKGLTHTIPFDPKDVNSTAPRTISFLLTGSPQNKITKGVKRTARLTRAPMLTAKQIDAIWPGVAPNHLGYPMDEKSLSKVATVLDNDFISTLMRFRHCTKIMNTYIGPFLEQAAESTNIPTVHPTLNYVRTATGRLSSSNPNGQNMPEEARQLFKSMHGNLAEIDFKQLEIIALAMKSSCPFLRKDIIDGGDIHFNTGKSVFGWKQQSDMNETDRKKVKAVNFGVLFGGTAFGLAISTGLPRKLVQSLIDSLYRTYPGVDAWHDRIVREVDANKVPSGLANGTQIYHSDMVDPGTGRVFRFKQQKTKFGNTYIFKPTQIKNYPVQGYAGGDIVMIALDRLWRGLDKSVGRLRMTVHDSILVDYSGTKEVLEAHMNQVCKSTCTELQIDLPLKFDISIGRHWS